MVGLSLADDESGWAVVNCWAAVGNRAPTTGFVYRLTKDNWQLVSDAPDIAGPYACYTGVSAISANEMWAIGLRDDIYVCQDTNWLLHYRDGQWEEVDIDYLYDTLSTRHRTGLHSIASVDADNVWVGGKGVIFKYTEGSWTIDLELPVKNSGFDNIFYAINMSSLDGGWTWAWRREGSAFFRYQDNTWIRWQDLTFDENTFVTDIDTIYGEEVWAVGYKEDSRVGYFRYIPQLWQYHDSQWFEVELPIEEGALQSIRMIDANEGWITGGIWKENPIILHYTNGRWESVPPPSDAAILSVDATMPDNVWIGAEKFYWRLPPNDWQPKDIVSIIE